MHFSTTSKSGVAQYSVSEVTSDKRKVRDQGRGGRTSHLGVLGIWPFQACLLSFHSWVAGSGVQYTSLICTPNHQRGKLRTPYHRVVGKCMTNGTGHRPMHSASLCHCMMKTTPLKSSVGFWPDKFPPKHS